MPQDGGERQGSDGKGRRGHLGLLAEVSGLTFEQLLVFSADSALPVVVALRASMPTIDLAYQIRAGRPMLDNMGSLLRVDPFTFTVFGRPWLNQQWGAQVVFAALFRAGGWSSSPWCARLAMPA